MLQNVWPLLAIAIGQTLVLLIGGIDLSQTSIMAITSVAGAVIMTDKVDPVLFEKSSVVGHFPHRKRRPAARPAYSWVVAIAA